MSRRKKVLIGLVCAFVGLMLIGTALAPSRGNYYGPRKTVRVVEDIGYLAGSANPKHKLDLYLPKTGSGPFPVIVFVHGGFWRPMDRRLLQPFTGLHGSVGVALANAGLVTAVLSYRQYPEAATVQAAIDDVAGAVRYVIDHISEYGGDPNRVFVVGHSAGGMITALLALAPDHLLRAGVAPAKLRGFACLGGAYELTDTMKGVAPKLAEKVRASVENDEGLRNYSPLYKVRAEHPPMMILVGDREAPSLHEQFKKMDTALRTAGGDVTSVEVRGEDHMDLVMNLSRPDNQTRIELLRFITSH